VGEKVERLLETGCLESRLTGGLGPRLLVNLHCLF